MTTLVLTTQQLVAAVQQLDGERLPVSTLAGWAQSGLVVPSVRFVRRRGRYGVRIYNLSDLARVRLIVRLRRAGISMPRVVVILAFLDAELREVMRPKTRAALVIDGARAYVTRPGAPAIDVPSGQQRLPLAECFVGNEQAARAAQRVA